MHPIHRSITAEAYEFQASIIACMMLHCRFELIWIWN
jgi:hypothetical protein